MSPPHPFASPGRTNPPGVGPAGSLVRGEVAAPEAAAAAALQLKGHLATARATLLAAVGPGSVGRAGGAGAGVGAAALVHVGGALRGWHPLGVLGAGSLAGREARWRNGALREGARRARARALAGRWAAFRLHVGGAGWGAAAGLRLGALRRAALEPATLHAALEEADALAARHLAGQAGPPCTRNPSKR